MVRSVYATVPVLVATSLTRQVLSRSPCCDCLRASSHILLRRKVERVACCCCRSVQALETTVCPGTLWCRRRPRAPLAPGRGCREGCAGGRKHGAAGACAVDAMVGHFIDLPLGRVVQIMLYVVVMVNPDRRGKVLVVVVQKVVRDVEGGVHGRSVRSAMGMTVVSHCSVLLS